MAACSPRRLTAVSSTNPYCQKNAPTVALLSPLMCLPLTVVLNQTPKKEVGLHRLQANPLQAFLFSDNAQNHQIIHAPALRMFSLKK